MKFLTIDSFCYNQAPRPSKGPHKLRECLPLAVLLRNRLKYALNYSEVTKIIMQRLIKIDGKIRTDKKFPAGFMGKYSVLTEILLKDNGHQILIVIDGYPLRKFLVLWT